MPVSMAKLNTLLNQKKQLIKLKKMETTETVKTKWAIDPMHSEIGFKVKHLMFTNVRGTFKEYEASIYTPDNDFMNAEIDFWLKDRKSVV